MLPYILLILLLPVLQGCLVVQTPKCECPILALSSSNIAQHVGDHAFYKNVSGYPMSTPVFKSEGCLAEMDCEGDYSLVLFDKETVTMLGANSAIGYCNPRIQKWDVDTVSGTGLTPFDRLFGICVDYSPAKCECPVLAMSFSNIAQNVGSHQFYQNVSGYPMVTPVVKSEDCSVSMYCEGDYSLVLFDKETAIMLGAYSADGICDPRTQKWQVDTGSGAAFTSFDRLFGICVNYAPCDCSFRKISDNAIAKEILTNNYRWDRYKVLHFSEPIWNTETGMCSSDFHCKESGHGKITIAGDTYVMEDNVQLECTSEKKWTIRVSGEEYPRRINAELLDIGCYKRETCNPTFPCSYKAIDKLSELINHPLYENLTPFITKIEAPEVTIDGCYVTMTCNAPYSMAILDDENIYPSPDRTVRVQCLPGPIWHFWQTLPTHPFYGTCLELK
ncbi:unnamed protein product [Caenorhabditis brenneri]